MVSHPEQLAANKCAFSKLQREHRDLLNSEQRNDPVNNPSHYTFGKFEVIDVLMDWFGCDPLLWQVGKYIARSKHKGRELEDLKKAEYYLKKKIEQLQNGS